MKRLVSRLLAGLRRRLVGPSASSNPQAPEALMAHLIGEVVESRVLPAVRRDLEVAVGALETSLHQKFHEIALSINQTLFAFSYEEMRKPILNRIDDVLAALATVRDRLQHGQPTSPHGPDDMNVLLNGLVRELTRLQMQVEVLQHTLDGSDAVSEGLSLVGNGEDAAADPFGRERGGRIRVG